MVVDVDARLNNKVSVYCYCSWMLLTGQTYIVSARIEHCSALFFTLFIAIECICMYTQCIQQTMHVFNPHSVWNYGQSTCRPPSTTMENEYTK